MKRTVLAAMVAVGLSAAISAQGQMVTRAAAQIPFSFNVGSQAYPAGKCEITLDVHPSIVAVQCDGVRERVMALSFGVSKVLPVQQGKLVFNKYGERYFLSQIWLPGRSAGRELGQSKAERELAARQRGPEQIVLALR